MSTPYKYNEVWETMKKVVWYKWTTYWNHGGDVVSWIDATDPENLQRCRGLVRREDGLIFQNSKECRKCLDDEAERTKNRGFQVGYFFRGTGILGEEYDGAGSKLHRGFERKHQ